MPSIVRHSPVSEMPKCEKTCLRPMYSRCFYRMSRLFYFEWNASSLHKGREDAVTNLWAPSPAATAASQHVASLLSHLRPCPLSSGLFFRPIVGNVCKYFSVYLSATGALFYIITP